MAGAKVTIGIQGFAPDIPVGKVYDAETGKLVCNHPDGFDVVLHRPDGSEEVIHSRPSSWAETWIPDRRYFEADGSINLEIRLHGAAITQPGS